MNNVAMYLTSDKLVTTRCHNSRKMVLFEYGEIKKVLKKFLSIPLCFNDLLVIVKHGSIKNHTDLRKR